jgi:hypothetical protein
MTRVRPKEDVLVHYDEESGELVFFTVPASSSASIRESAFGGVRPSVAELRSLDPAEAMRRVGGTVLAFLDLSSKTKLGIAKQLDEKESGDEL